MWKEGTPSAYGDTNCACICHAFMAVFLFALYIIMITTKKKVYTSCASRERRSWQSKVSLERLVYRYVYTLPSCRINVVVFLVMYVSLSCLFIFHSHRSDGMEAWVFELHVACARAWQTETHCKQVHIQSVLRDSHFMQFASQWHSSIIQCSGLQYVVQISLFTLRVDWIWKWR